MGSRGADWAYVNFIMAFRQNMNSPKIKFKTKPTIATELEKDSKNDPQL